MSSIKVVLGSLFGDEGKGVTVNWLCKQATAQGNSCAVVRYCNGPQAGHTVVENGIRHVFSSFGSGTLVGCPTIYDNCYLDVVCFVNEYKTLMSKGVYSIQINVGKDCKLISPYDVIANRQDEQNLEHGTCGKGVYKAVCRPVQYTLDEVIGPGKDCNKFFAETAKFYGIERIPKLEAIYKSALLFIHYLYDFNKDITPNKYDILVYEGSQGLLLDAEKGFLPYVTATSIVPNFKLLPKGSEVYLVCRSYLTRHGNYGDTISLSKLPYQVKKDYTNLWNPYQGEFYKGMFNVDLLAEAFKRHNLHEYDHIKYNLVITHCDDIRPEFQCIVNDKIRDVSLTSFIETIRNNIGIPFDHIYTNSSEESNLIQII